MPFLRFLVTSLCFFASTNVFSQQEQKPEQKQANTAKVDGITFTLAEGLEIEKVAGGSLVKWPMVVDWDRRGRLVVAESGGVGSPIAEHNKKKLHKIIRLVDEDGDGTFDRRIVAADQMDFPEGVLCLGDDILVCAPPVIWKLTDADGDGICEKRSVWFDGQTLTYCANDLHGPYLGRDGWIYWCKGAFGKQTHAWSDGRKFESSAAHIFRRRLEGGPIEPVISGGMDNPVEVAFTPEGEKFFTSTWLHFPGGGLRDGMAHAVYGGLFGKDHEVIDNQVRTGALMPVMTQLGPGAPSGLACLESNRLIRFATHPEASVLVAAIFNLQKLSAHQLVPDGASYRSIDHDLVVADRIDFHPTDVIEDRDGSLLLVDTGGWYDLCCPSSRIDQTTASGGIYRITSVGTRMPIAKPVSSLTGASEDSLAGLYDPRPWVRRSALLNLGNSGSPVESLTAILNDVDRPRGERLTAVWALCHVGDEKALRSITHLLSTKAEDAMLQAACHVVSVHGHQGSLASLVPLLQHKSLPVRRAAAEAIGRIGDANTVEKLLEAYEVGYQDRHLEHSLLYALIEISRRDSAADLMAHATNEIRLRAAMLALDQAGRASELRAAQVFESLESDHERLAATAADVLARHPEWASESTDHLNRMLSRKSESLARIVSNWKREASMQDLVRRWLEQAPSSPLEKQEFLAKDLQTLSPAQLPASWCAPIAAWLSQANPSTRRFIVSNLQQVLLDSDSSGRLSETLVDLASDAEATADCLSILAALPLGFAVQQVELERAAVDAFLGEDETLVPSASSVLGRLKLSSSRRLIDALPNIASRYLITAIESVHRTGDAESETRMLNALSTAAAAKTLPRNFLIELYQDSSDTLRQQAKQVSEELTRPPADIQKTVAAKLAQLAQLEAGDPVRGMQVFHGKKVSCSTCHKIGYVGSDIGPELTQIGGSRTREALLEAILFPNARLEQSYRSTQVLTIDGIVYTGLIAKQDGDRLTLLLSAERSIVIPYDEIEERQESNVSVMPSGLADQLSMQELSDLLAFLQSAK